MAEFKNRFTTNGIPERSMVLQALGITKEQDDELQNKFSDPNNYYIDPKGTVTLWRVTKHSTKENRLKAIQKRKSKRVIDEFRINP